MLAKDVEATWEDAFTMRLRDNRKSHSPKEKTDSSNRLERSPEGCKTQNDHSERLQERCSERN